MWVINIIELGAAAGRLQPVSWNTAETDIEKLNQNQKIT